MAGVLLPRVGDSDIIADVITCSQLDPLEGPGGLPHVYCSDCLRPWRDGDQIGHRGVGCRLCRGKQNVDPWALDEISS